MRGANAKTEVGEVPRGLHINAGKEGVRLLATGIMLEVSVAAFYVHVVIRLGSPFFPPSASSWFGTLRLALKPLV